MEFEKQVNFLKITLNSLPSLVTGLSDAQFRWKPPSGNWSVLEILAHMVVEESDDFRPRVKSTLEDPSRPWPDYDPEGIVVEEKFNEKDPHEVLREFVRERTRSLDWLASLQKPDWSLAYQHPRIGPLRAGDLFVSWVAHD